MAGAEREGEGEEGTLSVYGKCVQEPDGRGYGRRIHMGFQDPASVSISDKEKRIVAFRQVRDRMVEQLVPRIRHELGI